MKKLTIATIGLFIGILFITIGSSSAQHNIIDFEIEVELKNNTKYDIEYEVKEVNKIEAKYSVPGTVTLHGKNAVEVIEPLFNELNLMPNMATENLDKTILAILKIKEEAVEDFEFEVKFWTGEKIKIDE